MIERKKRNPYDRFIEKVYKTDSCWFWTGAKDTPGYGRMVFKGKIIGAHQFSWMYFNKDNIPKGLVIMHTCDIKICVNPKHLKLGTYKDNIADMHNKKRGRKIETYTSGENHFNSKLTNKQAIKIRDLYATGKYSWMDLANKFSISKRATGYIIQNVTYKKA